MSSQNPDSPGAFERKLTALQNGIQTELPASETYNILGQTYTRDQLAQKTGGYLAASTAAREARSAERTAKQARDRVKPEATEFVNAVHAYLVGRLGETNESLKDFGFTPRKKAAPLTGEERVLKAAKAKATRQKRGTLGSRQKAAITGTAPSAVTVTNPDAGTTPPPAAK